MPSWDNADMSSHSLSDAAWEGDLTAVEASLAGRADPNAEGVFGSILERGMVPEPTA